MKCLVFFFLMTSPVYAAIPFKEFNLRRLDASQMKPLSSYSQSNLAVVIAYGNECPILRKHIPALNKIYVRYSQKVAFFLVNSVPKVKDQEILKETKEYALIAPIYYDEDMKLSKELGLSTFSESVLVDLKNNKVLFKGAINNQFTLDLSRPLPTENYLENAIKSTLAGKEVEVRTSTPFGCEISY